MDGTSNPLAEASVRVDSGDSDTMTRAELKREMARFKREILDASSPVATSGCRASDDSMHAVLARVGAAPTNWHQATVFFLTSKADEDMEMRAKAPFMYAASLLMVLMQFLATMGIAAGMMFPTCVQSSQCQSGCFCYKTGSSSRGLCTFCGSVTPLVPYWSPPGTERTGYGPTGYEKQWNVLSTSLYPRDGLRRPADAVGFAGFNVTHVKATCTPPFQKVRRFTILTEDEVPGYARRTLTWTGEDVPPGIVPSRVTLDHHIGLQNNDFSASSVGAWCDNCVYSTGDVSHLSEHLLAFASVEAMSTADWLATVVCTYVFAVTMVGEIKDIELCQMAANRGHLEVSRRWQMALSFLNLFRAHGFVMVLVMCIPLVILTRGGGSLDVAFNTIAIMFLTEVDNISYQFALSERAKQRVDEAGHVRLTDIEEKRLSRTKPCCVVIISVGILLAIYSRTPFVCALVGPSVAGLCKASELLSMQDSSASERLIFIVQCLLCQAAAFFLLVGFMTAVETNRL